MHFTIWPNLTTPTGKHTEIEWSVFLTYVSAPVASPEKATLSGWSPVRCVEDTRAGAGVELVSAIVLDDDKSGLPLERVCELWAGIAGVVHTTHSHTPELPKYRIVLRVSRDMAPSEHARVWRAVRDHAAANGQTLDQSTKDPSRFWYEPAHREGSPYAWCELAGVPIDVDAALASVPSAESPAAPASAIVRQESAAPSIRSNAAARLLADAWPALGSRHGAKCALAGALYRDGRSEADAIDFLRQVCAHVGSPDGGKPDAVVRSTYARAVTHNVTGWNTLTELVDAGVVKAARDLLSSGRFEETCAPFERRAEVTAMAETALTADDLGVIWGRWDEPVIVPPYLLAGLIPAGKVTTVFAEGGSVKTWATFALAISVATGRPWLGEHMVQQGKVLLLDFEDGREEFKRRKRFLTRSDEDIAELGYKYGDLDLLKSATWEALAKLDLKLIVIDALGSAMPGNADENVTTFAAAVKLAGKFTEATGCSVIFVHHANKNGGMRGTSAIRDQSDVAFKFEPVSETDDVKRMRMVCDKPGPQKRPAPVNLELSDAGLRTFKDEAQAVGRNAETSEGVQAAIRLALANGPVETRRKLREAVGGAMKRVEDELDALIARREAILIPGKGYTLDGPAQRRERVVLNVQGSDKWTSAAKLAKASYVDTRFVEELLREGIIFPRVGGDGRHGFIARL